MVWKCQIRKIAKQTPDKFGDVNVVNSLIKVFYQNKNLKAGTYESEQT